MLKAADAAFFYDQYNVIAHNDLDVCSSKAGQCHELINIACRMQN